MHVSIAHLSSLGLELQKANRPRHTECTNMLSAKPDARVKLIALSRSLAPAYLFLQRADLSSKLGRRLRCACQLLLHTPLFAFSLRQAHTTDIHLASMAIAVGSVTKKKRKQNREICP